MGILEWAGVGIVMLIGCFISFRIMRRGLPTYDDHKREYLRHMAETHQKLAEDVKNISAREQINLMHAALEDFVRMEATDAHVEVLGNELLLATPQAEWRIRLIMRERMLASSKKVIHGQSRWLLVNPGGTEEEFADCARLMASLNARFHGVIPEQPEPEFVSRRLARCRRQKSRKNV